MASEKIVLCDTNILIEALKQDKNILKSIDAIGHNNLALSVITSAELLFGARDKVESKKIKKSIDFLRIIPINFQICELFLNLVDKYALSHRVGIPDTFIAATALYFDIELFTLNQKDFRFISGIKLFESGSNKE